MHVAFRCDASSVIGSGHVVRCLTLAKVLVDRGAKCSFLCRTLPGNMMDQIADAGHRVYPLPAPKHPVNSGSADGDYAGWLGVSAEADAVECRAVFDAILPDRVVVDHYALDIKWEEAACRHLPIMVIDDLANRPHRCDILLDQNLGHYPKDYDGLVPQSAVRLIGPANALLRPEFAAARPSSLERRSTLSAPTHALVFMGGMDRENSTEAILGILAKEPLPEAFRLSVVMGRTAPHLEAVVARARSMPFPTEVLVDVRDMASLLAQADLVIGAAGGSAWERCCLGIPTIVLTLADNQKSAALALQAQGAVFLIGDMRDGRWDKMLVEGLRRLSAPDTLLQMSKSAAAITDGNGAQWVASHLFERNLTARKATQDDARLIWDWRHAGDATIFYRSPYVTPFEDHLKWLQAALDSPKHILQMIEKSGDAIGHVRVDRDASSPIEGTVSICISPSIRGQNLSRAILERGLREAAACGVSRFLATVHRHNTASMRLFVGAGFREISTDEKFVHLALVS